MATPHWPTLPSGANMATYPLPQREDHGVVSVQFESGHTETRPIWSKPVRAWRLIGRNLPLADVDIVMAFLRDRKHGGNFFYWDVPVIPIWSPYDAPTTSTTTSGAIGARTYYIAIAYSDGTNTTKVSQESTQVVAGNDLATVTVPQFPTGVTEARVYIGTVSGALYFAGTESSTGGTWTEPFSTVDSDSNSGQKVLNVAATTDFESGQGVVIGEGTARDENRIIDTVQAGVSITLTENLTYTHTAVQADEVYIEGTTGTAAPTSNTLTGEEVKVRLVGKPEPTLIATGVYELIVDIEEMF